MSDYISREAVKQFLRMEMKFSLEAMVADPEVIPSADVRANIHGHWGRLTRVENVYSIDGVKTWGIKCQCDKCTFTTIAIEGFGFYDYCPNCGSRNTVVEDKPE